MSGLFCGQTTGQIEFGAGNHSSRRTSNKKNYVGIDVVYRSVQYRRQLAWNVENGKLTRMTPFHRLLETKT